MDNQLPHNREAEEAIIGAMLINQDAFYEISRYITGEDFYIRRHRWIWEVFTDLHDDDQALDIVTISEQLEKRGQLKDVGGAAYLMQITTTVPSSLHASEYAKIIREKSIRRDTIKAANELAKTGYDNTTEIVDARSKIALELSSIRDSGGAVHFSKWLSDGYDLLEEWAKNPQEIAGLPTGLGDLDKVFGDGIMPGLNLLLGAPGVGKSILAQSIVTHWVKNDIPSAYYAGEMSWKDVYLRIISDQSNVKVSDMRKGKTDFSAIIKAHESLEQRPLFGDDPGYMTTAGLRADLTKLKMEHGIKGVVFDFLTDLADMPGLEEWARAEYLAIRVQKILVDLDLCGLFVHEMTKGGWKNKDMAGISGGKKVAHRAVCAVMLNSHMPHRGGEEKDDLRTVINIKPPRLVEGYEKACNLYKNPEFPRFGLATKFY